MNNHKHLDYIDYIDFIKGIAAVSVIFLHTLPTKVLLGSLAVYHIWQAVPLFLFITFYLGFRNIESKDGVFNGYYSLKRVKKIFVKLWLPLIILALTEASFFFIIGNRDRAIGSILCYNNGPGSYYIWCYMQIWILMPFIYLILTRWGVLGGGYFVDYQCAA